MADAGALAALIAAKEIVVTCGSGGVGKTTTAAAIGAMAAANHGGKVLVLTVDPARRLATALGLQALGNLETQVPDSAWAEAGVRPRGELWAAMLDTKQSWDGLVRRHAPDAATTKRILENPLYQNIAGKFVQSHDYIAMERLYELHSEGRFDLIVVDTPPARNALDFIEAPQRMAEFFSSRLLRLLIVPYRSRFVNVASRPFYQIADRILGSQFLADIAEFFILFQTMYSGFVTRARAVERLLADRRTTFVVVSTLEPAPAREAEFFIKVLKGKRLPLGALVLNKTLAGFSVDEQSDRRARELTERSQDIAARLVADGPLAGTPASQVALVLHEVGESFANMESVAQREATQRRDLPAVDVVVNVPEMSDDVHDLAGLLRLGGHLWA